MRDPTRGGLATVCQELLRATGLGVILQQAHVPVRDPVQSVCDMLGYDPLYLACEGRVVAVVDDAHADALLQCWRSLPSGSAAACIGHLSSTRRHVVLQTGLGGERLLEELEDDPLPRIC
jgi:hydrogenase expression/formation protein HypE